MNLIERYSAEFQRFQTEITAFQCQWFLMQKHISKILYFPFQCIVQSYLQWLKDSDYDSTCTLCKVSLDLDDCIRLICYRMHANNAVYSITHTLIFYVFLEDVFHWKCLNERESSLPANTAPGGHTCPSCYDQIFPPSNLISPVADVLRNRLRQTTWGRDDLGLLLVSVALSMFEILVTVRFSWFQTSNLSHRSCLKAPVKIDQCSRARSITFNLRTIMWQPSRAL